MIEKISTGRYQVCKNKTGIANSTQILITGNKEEIESYWKNMCEINTDKSFNYYITEEVFYRGTQKDKNGNSIDTLPGFQRIV